MAMLHILHTNDLHSHLENWPTILKEMELYKQQLPAEDDLLVMDLGDHLDRSHIYTEATEGKGNVLLLNQAGYDYVTIGNNEGITLSHQQLESLYEEADFQVVIANFFDTEGNRPSWVKPFVIHETSFHRRIGIFGVTAAYDDYYKQLGWHVTDPLEAATEVVNQLSNQVDYLICLAHVGRSHEEELVSRFPAIHLILGAHTHHQYPDNFKIQETSLAAGGKWGQFLGVAQVAFEKTGPVTSTRLVDMQNSPLHTSKENEAASQHWQIEGEQLLSGPVFYNEKFLKASLQQATDLSDRLGDALLSYTGADCALYPAGLLLTNLDTGNISSKAMHDLLPHPINPCVVTLSGAELIEAYQVAQNSKWPTLEVRGLGFRGKQLGKLLFRNFDRRQDGYYINQQPLKLNELYKLVTVDMFTFGYFFPRFKELPKTYFMPETIRDVFIAYSSQHKD